MSEKNEIRLNMRVSEEIKKRLKIFMAENNLTSYDQSLKLLLDGFHSPDSAFIHRDLYNELLNDYQKLIKTL